MSDQVATWLQVIIGLVSLVFPLLSVLKKPSRCHARTVRFSHWKIGSIERTRLDVTDDSQG